MACQTSRWVQVGLYLIRTDRIVCIRIVRPKEEGDEWNVAILYDNKTVKSINHRCPTEEEALDFCKNLVSYQVLVDYK